MTSRRMIRQRCQISQPTTTSASPPSLTAPSSESLPASSSHRQRSNGRNGLRYRVLFSFLFVVVSYARSNVLASTTVAVATTQAGEVTNATALTDITTPRSVAFEGERNCTPPAIEEFPRDFFTQEQRAEGGIVVHILISVYLVVALGTICDDYFVPVLEIICEALNLKPDVAGATFMAAGTSSPEFFTNVMGTFVTHSDLGIGTIVGSAVFNIFGVISVCGLFSGKKIALDWYPITRDCFIYGITVIILIIVLIDEKVYWYESLVMIVAYVGYIILMVFNPSIEAKAQSAKKKIRARVFPSMPMTTESTPLHSRPNTANNTKAANGLPGVSGLGENDVIIVPASGTATLVVEGTENASVATEDRDLEDNVDGMDDARFPWKRPDGAGFFGTLWWILFFPINMLFFLTIPDVRYPVCAKFFPLSFFMCMAWIGAISYVLTWMITVIGYTLAIPDTVMGLTFLAVGTSVPEVISSLIVSRQGKGSMAVSNSIGSNTFDILLCLGLPWMLKAILEGTGFDATHGEWLVRVNSEGLAYTVISLLLSLILLYTILLAARFVLSRTLGFVCLVIYGIFVTISILFELNVFFVVNKPSCPSDF